MTDWQPISTAPKDGTRILAHWLYHGDFAYEVVAWDEDSKEWFAMSFGLQPPTHWMPLPEAPHND